MGRIINLCITGAIIACLLGCTKTTTTKIVGGTNSNRSNQESSLEDRTNNRTTNHSFTSNFIVYPLNNAPKNNLTNVLKEINQLYSQHGQNPLHKSITMKINYQIRNLINRGDKETYFKSGVVVYYLPPGGSLYKHIEDFSTPLNAFRTFYHAIFKEKKELLKKVISDQNLSEKKISHLFHQADEKFIYVIKIENKSNQATIHFWSPKNNKQPFRKFTLIQDRSQEWKIPFSQTSKIFPYE